MSDKAYRPKDNRVSREYLRMLVRRIVDGEDKPKEVDVDMLYRRYNVVYEVKW